MKVLIVEDDETTREMLARALEQMGCETVAVADGADALAAVAVSIKSVPYDLVIIDVAMRYVDGFALAKAIRCFEQNDLYAPAARVKFHTAHPEAFGNSALLEQSGVSGEDCYLKARDTARLFDDLRAMCPD